MLEYYALQETPNTIGIIGGLMISFAILLSGVKKVADEKLRSDHPIKSKYFKFFFTRSNSPVNAQQSGHPI